jgi:CRISPR-associated protein Csx10
VKALRYRIELEERVLAAGRGGDPNTVVTRPYLPGSLLRGAFIEAFLSEADEADSGEDVDLAADPDTRSLFFDGSVRYLNGYLVDEEEEIASDRRMLPTPRSWRQKKDERRRFKDFAAEEPSPAAWTPPYQTLGNPFCVLPRPGEERGIWFGQPKETLKTHHQRPDAAERRGEDTGDIYRYVSLSAGQTFEALVLCDEPACAGRILQWMGGGEEWRGGGPTWSLGKSRSTQGGVQTRLESAWEAGQGDPWGEAPEIGRASRLEDQDVLVVTLLSDLLARDAGGQFVAGPEAITRALNRALEAIGEEECFSAPKRVYMEPSLAGGFNREWGLHLPEADAAAMGSVLVYPNPDLSPESLRALEWRGIGSRRAEGFGRIAFNLHGQSSKLEVETDEERGRKTNRKRRREGGGPTPRRELRAGTPSHAIAGQMAERMLRHRLDPALDEAVTSCSVRGSAPSSQIGGLRALLQRALLIPKREEQRLDEGQEFNAEQSLERGRGLIREYIEDVKSRASARSRFEGVFVQDGDDSTPLLEWVRQRVNDGTGPDEEASIWDVLLHGAEARPEVGTVEAELTDRLAYVYNLRLAHDVLARASGDEEPQG